MPEKKPRPITHYTVFLIHDKESIALRKRPKKGLLAGLYEFPNTEGTLSEEAAVHYVRGLGFSPLRLRPLPAAKHLFTHREWQLSGYDVLTDELRLEDAEGNVGSPDHAVEGAVSAKAQPVPTDVQKKPDGTGPSGIMLVSLQAIREEYSIPSAFSVYKEYLLHQA